MKGGLPMLKVLPIFLLVLFLSGCATPRTHRETLANLHNRIALLEQKIQQKDEQIRILESELRQEETRPKREERKEISGLTVRQIQTALKNAGFYRGAIDGKLGPQTRQAIREFQKANGLKPDGIVGKRTAEKLNAFHLN